MVGGVEGLAAVGIAAVGAKLLQVVAGRERAGPEAVRTITLIDGSRSASRKAPSSAAIMARDSALREAGLVESEECDACLRRAREYRVGCGRLLGSGSGSVRGGAHKRPDGSR